MCSVKVSKREDLPKFVQTTALCVLRAQLEFEILDLAKVQAEYRTFRAFEKNSGIERSAFGGIMHLYGRVKNIYCKVYIQEGRKLN